MAAPEKIFVADGILWTQHKGKRKSVLSLNEALEIIAQCCGVSCACDEIRLQSKNGIEAGTYTIYIENDTPKLRKPNGTVLEIETIQD